MTHCRTGCGAEINYKRVHFSSPVDWYDIPMEQYQTSHGEVDVIHDCPKLKPSTNDGANDVLKELQEMHLTLNDYCLRSIVEDFASPILDFIDLPQKLKMHSKELMQRQSEGHPENLKIGGLGPPGYMPREDFDKLSKSEKEEYKEFYGSEPPNKTPGERQAEFLQYINTAFDFLQRCADRFPAPFYTDSRNTIDQYICVEYSQLELFRIFLESKGQYADAMNCHIIQGAVDIAKSQMNADAFIEVTDRLQKKLEEQRLANEWTSEDTLAEKKRLMKTGMDEKEAESEAEMEGVTHAQVEEGEREYPASIMNWALEQYRKEFDRPPDEALEMWRGEDPNAEELDALEHNADQSEEGNTVDKEQSVEELLKPHSQENFGNIHKRLREFILRLYDGKFSWAELGKDGKTMQIQIQGSRKKQSKTSYTFTNKSDLGVATLGQLVAILRNPVTAKKARGIDEYESVVDQCKVVLSCRNNLDHDERTELPPGWKIANAGLCIILNEFFDNLKYR